MPTTVRVRVPATTANLGPGFDALGLALDLVNETEITHGGKPGLRIEVGGLADASLLPTDEHNLVFRALRRVFELAGETPQGLDLKLTVRAPLARGLGSSASAIVAGMAGAAVLLGDGLSPEGLLDEMVRMEGHPDNVVACLRGGLVVCAKAGDAVIHERFAPHPSLRYVVLIPDYELPTSKSRQAIPKSVPFRDAVFNLSRVPLVIERLRSGNLDDLAVLMDDRLHQPYRKQLVQGYDLVALEAERAGAGAVVLSGAGPTMLAVCVAAHAEAVRKAMSGALGSLGVGCRTMALEADMHGCRAEIVSG
jgi:homoserine kinase